MQGLMLLQQTFDLTDKEAVKQFAFNFEWHYALDIGDDSDQSTYVSENTLEHAPFIERKRFVSVAIRHSHPETC